MDNYGSSSGYPYNNPYPYPYHQPPSPNHAYPAPAPAPSADPYYHPYPYPYSPRHPYPYPQASYSQPPPPAPASHSGPLDYHHQQPPPPAPTSYSSPLDYHHQQPPPPSPHSAAPIPYPYNVYPVAPIPDTVPQPTLQHHSSFQYGSSYHYPQPSQYPTPESNNPQVPSRANSFSNHHRQDSFSSPENYAASGNTTSHPSFYPPLDELLSNVHLSDNNNQTTPTSPSAPSMSPSSTALTTYQGSSLRYDEQNHFYGDPNDSFSSSWSGPYLGRADSSNYSAYSDSSSFNASQMQIVPLQQKGSLKVLLLHGNLDICVRDAKNLPNMDLFHKTLGDMFGKLPGNVGNKIEGHMSNKITSDPYVSISIGGAVIGRTFVISNSENPVWMQHFHVPVAHNAPEVHFIVKDNDVVGSQLIGIVSIPVEQLYLGEVVEGFYPIMNNSGKPCKPGAILSISIQYTPMEKLSIYHHGVGTGPDYVGVPGTYFPLRKGGTVTLYQDAHVPDGCLPNLKLDHGMSYVHGQCWRDIFDAICQAQRLIYITGWSVWHKVRLLRDGGPASDCTLGELLRSKSREGVRVLLLVWDDPTSRNILGYTTDGIMQTHDEETRRFFKHSSVQVLLCPRIAGKRHSWIKQTEVGTIYTHHQKTVIVDADAGNNRRKIIAFVGGLDLCDGRYDTPQHPLFRTLQTVHKDDYHNPTYTGNVVGCPREPWHDLHCKIDGPAAYDVLTNFEERWLKASKPHGIKKLKSSYDDALLRIERIQDIVGMLDTPCISENDPEGWHIQQIFRSIDSNSVRGFPKDPKDALKKNLVCGKNVLIDMSIHTAYVKAIRAAQHFIYIENQYFIGSSYNWSSYKNVGADNLIPMEIALKIAEKIRAHERFAAYIVIPMWPEGNPTGAATQRILFWQHKTMQMMYETIHKALVEVGLEDAFSPLDYLNFFCLGNREAVDGSDPTFQESPTAANTPQALSRKSRRFMIYVHSKGMIVDDEYVILGSANINQRSMEGTRDTEIAMGAYQPYHSWARKLSNPRGQIYGYRMSLWAEHTGTIEDCFTRPESLECVKRLRTMGEMNWKQYAADEITEMKGHLLKYPVEVDRKGTVRPLPGCEQFPDIGGNIVGSFIAIQENLTI
ncbi:C2 domain-containing protein/PLDc domain-containing protein/PLD_C domain-containing protein [Cephalotus follicularis]|uniref:Phospholipase D alpha 1 n=1 Tax=Cephalotus follicularis TaxID=3775 RepID=A0A1Q3C8X9_CEPFO|nr:C2 domain-containing protein/PLDc domain-containing protein/PLD_C domain-containing protein [Cephalotus follicularis]